MDKKQSQASLFSVTCGPGQQPNADRDACEDCVVNYYKNTTDREDCTACGDSLVTANEGTISEDDCFCKYNEWGIVYMDKP